MNELLSNQKMAKNFHQITWPATQQEPREVNVTYYRVDSDNETEVKEKMSQETNL